jgi:mannitol-specific phosphotransferase system IIBC component
MLYKISGTAGGTIVVILANIQSADMLKTAILAAIGAAVSFIMTWMLNRLTKKKQRQTQ